MPSGLSSTKAKLDGSADLPSATTAPVARSTRESAADPDGDDVVGTGDALDVMGDEGEGDLATGSRPSVRKRPTPNPIGTSTNDPSSVNRGPPVKPSSKTSGRSEVSASAMRRPVVMSHVRNRVALAWIATTTRLSLSRSAPPPPKSPSVFVQSSTPVLASLTDIVPVEPSAASTNEPSSLSSAHVTTPGVSTRMPGPVRASPERTSRCCKTRWKTSIRDPSSEGEGFLVSAATGRLIGPGAAPLPQTPINPSSATDTRYSPLELYARSRMPAPWPWIGSPITRSVVRS